MRGMLAAAVGTGLPTGIARVALPQIGFAVFVDRRQAAVRKMRRVEQQRTDQIHVAVEERVKHRLEKRVGRFGRNGGDDERGFVIVDAATEQAAKVNRQDLEMPLE